MVCLAFFFPMGQDVNKIRIPINEFFIMYFIFLSLWSFPLVWWCIFVAGKENLIVENWKERTTTPVAAKFWDKRRHRETTHFLSGMKNVVRRLLGLWKLKKITANMKYIWELLCILSMLCPFYISFKKWDYILKLK